VAAKNTRVIVGMAIGIAVVAAFVGALKWAMHEGGTPGTPLGSMDLLAPKPSLQLELASGATLHVRIDAKYEPRADLDERLRNSQLVVELLDASGTRHETRCTVATTDTCTLAVRAGGRHVVFARVTWAEGLVVSSASLDLRSTAH
jgi:hypothetical protein